MRQHKFLLAILILAACLRFYKLDLFPSGLHNDEASFLYNAQSLSATGRDEDGRVLPLFLNSYIDPKPALYSYLELPFVKILGVNNWSARLPTVILSLLSLYWFYRIILLLTKSQKLALIALFLLTISPWHIVNSRATQEVMMAFTFSLGAIYFLLKNNLCFLPLAFLSMYSYHSAKVFLPLILLALAIYIKKLKTSLKEGSPFGRKNTLSFLILGISLLILLFTKTGSDRFLDIGLQHGDTQLVLDEQIRLATPYTNSFLIRVFHNKIVNYSLALLNKYGQHFTLSFLFLQGGDPLRYQVPFHGLLYLVELPLLLWGIFIGLRNKNYQHLTYLMLFWLLISPLATILTTQEVISTIRSFMMLPPLVFLVSLALSHLSLLVPSPIHRRGIKGKVFLFFICAIYLWCFAYFLHQYFVFAPHYRPWHRNFAEEQMAEKVSALQNNYDKIYISRQSGQPYIYLALRNLITVSELQSSYPLRLQADFCLDKYCLVADQCFMDLSMSQTLFVISDSCKIGNAYQVLDKATFKDGAQGYQLVIPRVH